MANLEIIKAVYGCGAALALPTTNVQVVSVGSQDQNSGVANNFMSPVNAGGSIASVIANGTGNIPGIFDTQS